MQRFLEDGIKSFCLFRPHSLSFPLFIFYSCIKTPARILITQINTAVLAKWIECSPMVWETGVQSQVASYQRL